MIKLPEPKRIRVRKHFAIYVDENTFRRLCEMAIGMHRTNKKEASLHLNLAWKHWIRTREGEAARAAMAKLGRTLATRKGISGRKYGKAGHKSTSADYQEDEQE